MDSKLLPQHVSIIMDGNGRWAKARGKERIQGHIEGVNSVRACVEAAARAGVRWLSLYAFSEENWNRPAAEVQALMKLMVQALNNEIDNLVKNGIRLRVLGNLERLGPELQSLIESMSAKTEGGERMTLVIFLSYSGRWDILQAVKRASSELSAQQLEALDQDGFSRFLVTSGIPDPDLLIRTSGEQRISNYLLWQCAYTEFYYTDTLWPDFREPQLLEALEAYAGRDRRYGKVK
ncbi:MAG: di-trans,poly-cis-decaprenylcistransferase [Bacteroidales bacterium]|nr:di-trans,poly-cis-decaprenylcistransferase [Bacteroidales bacterium]